MSVCVPKHIVCQTYIPDFVADATVCTLQVFSERKSRLEAGGTLFRSVEVGTPTNNISVSCEWQTIGGVQTSIPDDVAQVKVIITDGVTIETYITPQSYSDPNWVVNAIPNLRDQINTTNPSSLIRMPEFDTNEQFVEPVDIVTLVDADHLAEFVATNLSGGNGSPEVAGLSGLRTGPVFSLVLIDSSEINNEDGKFDNIDEPRYWGQVDGSPVTLDWLSFTPKGDCLDPSDPNNVIIVGSGSPALPYECGILYRPVFNQDILNRIDEEASIISFSSAATDPNDDSITYRATNLPPDISIDTNTGLISGTIPIDASLSSPYDVTITADDGRGGIANDTFIWSVVIASVKLFKSILLSLTDTSYMTRIPSVEGNLKTWTWSGWIRPTELGTIQNLFYSGNEVNKGNSITIDSTNKIDIYLYDFAYVWRLLTTQVFDSVDTWYHIAVQVDTTNPTANQRVKLFVNNTQITVFDVENYPTLNLNGFINSTLYDHNISGITVQWLAGYLTEVNFVDGQSLPPTEFGELVEPCNGWLPKLYTGSYGTNGFYLDFNDSNLLGNDAVGSNNWVTTNITPSHQTDIVPNCPYYNVVIADNPVSYWRLGESLGTLAVDEIGIIDGTYVNTPTLGQTGLILSEADTSVAFNGTTQYISTGYKYDFIQQTGIFTIEVWIQLTDNNLDTIQDIAGTEFASAGIGWSMFYENRSSIGSPHSIRFLISKGTLGTYGILASSNTGAIVDNLPHHVVVTGNGSSVTFYVDGIQVGGPISFVGLSGSSSAANAWLAGSSSGTSAKFNGTLDEVVIYNYELTPTQILNHYTIAGY